MFATSLQSSRLKSPITNRAEFDRTDSSAKSFQTPIHSIESRDLVIGTLGQAPKLKYIKDPAALKAFARKIKDSAQEGSLSPKTMIGIFPQILSALDPKAVAVMNRTFKESLEKTGLYDEFRSLYQAVSRAIRRLASGAQVDTRVIAENISKLASILKSVPQINAAIKSYLKEVSGIMNISSEGSSAVLEAVGFGVKPISIEAIESGLEKAKALLQGNGVSRYLQNKPSDTKQFAIAG